MARRWQIIGCLFLVVLGLLVTGCGSERSVAVVPSSDRMLWAHLLGSASGSTLSVPVDAALVERVKAAARAGGARALDVTLLEAPGLGHVPVVTLQSHDPASYMKHELRRFLARIGYFKPQRWAFVELVDEDGRFAWSAGRFPNGGMVHPRPDLDQCSPISHHEVAGQTPPPCPAD